MLDPSGLRENLREFFLSDRAYLAFFVKEYRSVARRSGIDRHHVFLIYPSPYVMVYVGL